MQQLTWLTIAQIIAQYGLPFAQALLAKVEGGGALTSAELNALAALASDNAVDLLKARLQAKGIDLNSEDAKRLIQLAT